MTKPKQSTSAPISTFKARDKQKADAPEYYAAQQRLLEREAQTNRDLHAEKVCAASDRIFVIAPDVQASPECMTKQEARAKWPTKPIYWHGSSAAGMTNR